MRRLFENNDKIYTIQTNTILSRQNERSIRTFKVNSIKKTIYSILSLKRSISKQTPPVPPAPPLITVSI